VRSWVRRPAWHLLKFRVLGDNTSTHF
jgi:hypothetical protein